MTSTVRTAPSELSSVPADRLEIAGWTASAVDLWPGRTVVTVLLQGCPWHCTTCGTPDLRDLMVAGSVTWREVLEVLHRSRGALDGVVLAGGEPTRQDGILDAIAQIKALGMPVAVHTSGLNPQRVAQIAPMVDRLVLELRAPATRYTAVTGVVGSAHKAFASLRAAVDSGVELCVRTCVDPAVVAADDVAALRAEVAALGVVEHLVVEVPAAVAEG